MGTRILSFVKVYTFVLKEMFYYKPIYYVFTFVRFLIDSFLPLFSIVFSKLIIDELFLYRRNRMICIYVASFIIFSKLFFLIREILHEYISKKYNIGFSLFLTERLIEKFMEIPYMNIENREMLDYYEKAFNAANEDSGVSIILEQGCNFISGLLVGIITGVVFFRTVPYVFFMGIVFTIIATILQIKETKAEYNAYMKNVVSNRILSYLFNTVSDMRYGKDIRLYDGTKLFLNKIKVCKDKLVNTEKKKNLILTRLDSGIRLVDIINLGINLLCLGTLCFKRIITYGTFYSTLNCGSLFFKSISNMNAALTRLVQELEYVKAYVEVRTCQSQENNLEVIELEKIPNTISIEFRNVSFKYPKKMDYALKNVSVVIDSGEHVAIVGENGAGKSTFIKLICRLYTVDEGDILLNGRSIYEYSERTYRKLLGVVFQDFSLFASSLKENIIFDDNKDSTHLSEILNVTNLTRMIKKLDNKEDTSIMKIFDQNGIDPSGGEKQKIAIARMLYKDAPLLLLDEPTAALDPVAENEVFNLLKKAMKGKTTVIVSHRLLTCLFCERIIVFDDGRIVEKGCHEDLMDLQGKYAEIFRDQFQNCQI